MHPMVVTHVASRTELVIGWTQILFVTQGEGQRQFFRGFAYDDNERFSELDLDQAVVSGSLIPVEPPRPITLAQRIWLNPDGEIWLASETSPDTDPTRSLLAAGMRLPTVSFKGPLS